MKISPVACKLLVCIMVLLPDFDLNMYFSFSRRDDSHIYRDLKVLASTVTGGYSNQNQDMLCKHTSILDFWVHGGFWLVWPTHRISARRNSCERWRHTEAQLRRHGGDNICVGVGRSLRAQNKCCARIYGVVGNVVPCFLVIVFIPLVSGQ